jgi:hypothetical protein
VTSGPGRWGFNLTATDQNSVSYTKTMAIVVIGVPPSLPSIAPYGNFDDCSFGITCSRPMWVSNGAAPFTWNVTGLPPGLSYRTGSGTMTSWITPTDVELWGAPTATGSYNVKATVTDANGNTATGTYVLQVSSLFVDGNDNLPGGTRGVPYSHLMRVLGGVPAGASTYTTQIVQGVLPDGLSLTQMTVGGTPIENGNFSPQFLFTDSASHTLHSTQGFYISGGTSTINANTFNFYSPGSTTNIIGYWAVGSGISWQLNACCVPSYTWTQTGGTLPPGITLSPSGFLSGTFTIAGTYSFLVQVADSTNSLNYGSRLYTIVVVPWNITTGSQLSYGNVGSAYSATLSATIGGLTFTLLSGDLPPGLVLSSAGTISGTPAGAGLYWFWVQAQDASNNVLIQQFNISIYTAGVYPPLSLNVGSTLGPYTEGSFTYSLSASGGKPPYHYSITPGFSPPQGTRVQDGQPLPPGWAQTGGLLGVATTSGPFNTSLRVTDSNCTLGPCSTFDQPVTFVVSPLQVMSQGNLPKGTKNSVYASYALIGIGGSGNYSWSATNLPPGMNVSTGGLLSGAPTASGSFNPNVTLTDLTNQVSVGWGFNLIIDPYPITTGGVLPQATINTAYSQTLAAPGCGSGCTWSMAGGGLPGGLSVSSSGTISGTPTGTNYSSFTIQVSGSNGTVQKQFALMVVNTGQALSINVGTPFGDSTFGNQYNQFLNVTGGTPPYTWSIVDPADVPTGISLQGPGETLASNFTPGATFLLGRPLQLGVFNFTLKVTDSASHTATLPVTWRITSLNFNYTNLPISGTTLVYNTPYAQPLLVMGGSGNYTTWAVASGSSMPPGLVLNPTTGVISGMPANTGSFNTNIQVTDSASATMVQNINFNIASPTGTAVNIGVGPDVGTYQQGYETTINLNPSGGTPPYTFSLASGSALPAGCAVESGNTLLGNVSGSYFLVCVPQVTGTYSFTLIAQDSASTPNIGVRTLTIHFTPFTLYTSTSLPAGAVGQQYAQTLLVWDNSGTPSISLASGSSLPPGLGIVGNVLTGQPTAAGNYSFTLAITDGSGLTNNYTFTLAISTIAIADPQELPQQAIVNVPFTYAFTATGGGSNKTWSATNLPSGFSISSSGTLNGIANGAYRVRIAVTVTDGTSSATRAFAFTARQDSPTVLDFPLGNTTLPDAFVGASFSYTLSPDGGVAPYHWAVAAGSTLPPGLNLYSGTTVLPGSATPDSTMLGGAPAAVGYYTFDLIVTDSAGATARRTFSLNVSAMGILSGSLRTPIMGQAYNEQLTLVGGTPPYTFTYSPTGFNTQMFPPGLTASASGLISGTPTSTGNFGFYATVTDSSNLAKTFRASYSYFVNNSNGLRVTTGIPYDNYVGYQAGISLVTNGGSTYTWSLPSGSSSLPPGLSLSGSAISGATTAPGTYTFTVRATDNANPSNTADRIFSWVVTPMQVLFEVVNYYLPPATMGSPYSFTLNVAGGTPPYQFVESPFYPLPTGLSLSSAGVISGTPTVTGQFLLCHAITDSAGLTTKTSACISLSVLAPGQPNPVFIPNDQNSQYFGASPAVGAPFALPLDQFLAGSGTAPFTWSIASGYSFPPGLTILPGSGGTSAFAAGSLTTPGTYNFVMMVTDANGQTGYVYGQTSSQASLYSSSTPLPNGTVGTPYSASILAGGGTPPYTFQGNSNLPPGLTLSSSGILSGTPLYPGLFDLNYSVTDSSMPTPAVFYANTSFVIDQNGQAPGIGISPASVQLSYTLTGPTPAAATVFVTTTSGHYPFTASVSGIPGLTLSATSGTTPATLSLNLNTNGLSAGTYSGILALNSPQTVIPLNWIPVQLTVVTPPPCTYTLTPNTGSVSAAGGTGGFTVSTGSLCSWTPSVSAPSWIALTSGASGGQGQGGVDFIATNNTSASSRTGTITVGGQAYTITQFGSTCSYAISPSAISIGSAATSVPVSVAVSASGCPAWSASGLSASPASGTGNGTVTLAIPANTTAITQTLTATVAGSTFTVTQAGVNCVVSLSQPGVEVQSSGVLGASLGVTIPAGCSYNAVPGPSWITVASGGSGSASGQLVYSVAPNSSTTPRSGVMNIGGTVFQVTEDAVPCSVTVDASGLGSPFGPSGGTGPINITANGSNCSWTASSPVSWATLSQASGTGSATVSLTLSSNASSTTSRSAGLTVASQTVPVTQSGTVCTYSLTSSTATVPAAGASGVVGVIAPAVCGWTSSNNGSTWLNISSSGSAGSSNVQFVAAANTSANPQTATLTIAGLSFVVTQAGAPCSYTLSAQSSGTLSSGGTSGSFTYSTAASGCSPTAVSYSNWITITSPPGGSSGTVSYTVMANPNGVGRNGTIQLGDQTYSVNQTGATCGFSLNNYGLGFNLYGGTGAVQGSPSASGCVPSVGTSQPSIVTIGTLSGPTLNIFTLPYTVAPFASAVAATRRATVTFGGQVYSIKQTSW